MSLEEAWVAAAANPYYPTISKDYHFYLATTLLSAGLVLSGFFGLNQTFQGVTFYGAPASFAFGFGSVLMLCAVGVYI